jgi:hypothetical protein
MMAWPGTENVGFGTVGVGRGCVDVTSRKVESCLDVLGSVRVGYDREGYAINCRFQASKYGFANNVLLWGSQGIRAM